MFNPFRKRPEPRVVSVRTLPDVPVRADIDIPPFMRRTPEEQKAVDETWLDARVAVQKNSINRGILTCR